MKSTKKVLSPKKSGCEKFIRPEDLETGELFIKNSEVPRMLALVNSVSQAI